MAKKVVSRLSRVIGAIWSSAGGLGGDEGGKIEIVGQDVSEGQ